MRLLPRLAVASIAFATCGLAGQTFVDSSREELIQSVPELRALEFTQDQTPLDPILGLMGKRLESMLGEWINVSLAEQAHEMRFDPSRVFWVDHHDTFRYIARTHPFEELRTPPPTESPFLVATGFIGMLADLLPETQSRSRFRLLGRITESGRPAHVLAFRTNDGQRQGLVWLDVATKRILRLRTDALKPRPGESFDRFSRDVRYIPVTFSDLDSTLWLPSFAVADLHFPAGDLHTIHRFSDYLLEGSVKDTSISRRKMGAGEPSSPPAAGDDPYEILFNGFTALNADKPADAIPFLKAAEQQLPQRFEASYYLSAALRQTHDLTGAAAQLRQTLKLVPNLSAAHNDLGAILFEQGNHPQAIAEFQQALQLDPGNTTARANLEKAGTSLNSGSASTRPPVRPAAPPGGTIEVNVRQVLVPVIVTYKDGHHVFGLTQSDFQVFEDGVEQKITAFSSERADISHLTPPAAEPAAPDAATRSNRVRANPASRHVYLICLDLLHASFGNFASVRQALEKLFHEEQPGNSEYAVIAIGESTEIVQNLTSNPGAVLESLDGENFRTIYRKSVKAMSEAQESSYEHHLVDVRVACDNHDPTCPALKEGLPGQANALTEYEQFSTTQFLTQFRSLVEQLSRAAGRRTLVLISDGFLFAPGEIPFTLLQAYFPEFRSTRAIEQISNLIEPILQIAAKANVMIYTIDSRGLYASPTLDASRDGAASATSRVSAAWDGIATDEGMTLSEFAAATGGTAFQNQNDLLTGLERAFADGRDYYQIAYVPTNPNQDGKFRKIEVHVRDPKALVNAKRGYWATAQ